MNLTPEGSISVPPSAMRMRVSVSGVRLMQTMMFKEVSDSCDWPCEKPLNLTGKSGRWNPEDGQREQCRASRLASSGASLVTPYEATCRPTPASAPRRSAPRGARVPRRATPTTCPLPELPGAGDLSHRLDQAPLIRLPHVRTHPLPARVHRPERATRRMRVQPGTPVHVRSPVEVGVRGFIQPQTVPPRRRPPCRLHGPPRRGLRPDRDALTL